MLGRTKCKDWVELVVGGVIKGAGMEIRNAACLD